METKEWKAVFHNILYSTSYNIFASKIWHLYSLEINFYQIRRYIAIVADKALNNNLT